MTLVMLLGGPGGSLKVVVRSFPATPHSILAPFGSSWSLSGRSQSPLSSNLVPLSFQVEVKNHFFEPTWRQSWSPTCPPSRFSVDFVTRQTLIFAIPYTVFHGFSIFQQIASKMLSNFQKFALSKTRMHNHINH